MGSTPSADNLPLLKRGSCTLVKINNYTLLSINSWLILLIFIFNFFINNWFVFKKEKKCQNDPETK